MKVFGMWFGGANYAPSDQYKRKDIEEFRSIKHAKRQMELRNYDNYYPCIERVPPDDGGHYMMLFKTDPYCQDIEPDYILEYNMNGTLLKRRV